MYSPRTVRFNGMAPVSPFHLLVMSGTSRSTYFRRPLITSHLSRAPSVLPGRVRPLPVPDRSGSTLRTLSTAHLWCPCPMWIVRASFCLSRLRAHNVGVGDAAPPSQRLGRYHFDADELMLMSLVSEPLCFTCLVSCSCCVFLWLGSPRSTPCG